MASNPVWLCLSLFAVHSRKEVIHGFLLQLYLYLCTHCVPLYVYFLNISFLRAILIQEDKPSQNSQLFLSPETRLNLWRQIQCSDEYQIDRLIHEDARRVDSSNLYETQARAARRNYFFDAWVLLLSLVHGKFSWAAGSAVILLNGFTLRYLSGRPRVMDEVQGSNKKHICIHTIKCVTKERQVPLNEDPLGVSHIWSS